MKKESGPLAGLRVVEFGGIGPAPMCGMVLSDLGASVLRIDRPTPADIGIDRPLETNFILRGRSTIKLDLKSSAAASLALALIAKADCLIEGFRPGVMERLGLGPDVCLARNPQLVYGRVTGWGQTGPLAQTAGHDLNFVGLTGALEAMGKADEPPPVPLNLVGDFAGGALYLAVGILAAVLHARQFGQGQVIDAAIVDGVSSMLTSINGLRAGGVFSKRREDNILDSGAYFYGVYECADGRYVAVGAIEKRFFAELLAKLGVPAENVPPPHDRSRWKEGHATLAAVFATRTRDEWAGVFANSDACVSPVLSIEESFVDAHLRSRKTFVEIGGHLQAAPAPRFSATPASMPTPPSADSDISALTNWMTEEELVEFDARNVVICRAS